MGIESDKILAYLANEDGEERSLSDLTQTGIALKLNIKNAGRELNNLLKNGQVMRQRVYSNSFERRQFVYFLRSDAEDIENKAQQENPYLIYLNNFSNLYNKPECPAKITQEGIALAFGISRYTVRRYKIGPLIKQGTVIEEKRRIVGHKYRKYVYFLAPAIKDMQDEPNQKDKDSLLDSNMLEEILSN